MQIWHLPAAQNTWIYNNVFNTCKWGCVFGNDENQAGPQNTSVFNNTIDNCVYGIDCPPTEGWVIGTAQFENNIITRCTMGQRIGSASVPTVLTDFNLYGSGEQGNTNDFNWSGTNYSVAEMKDLNEELHSLDSADPLYIGTDNYHLRSGSPAIDAGTSSVATDVNGNPLVITDKDGWPRITYDIGAYEYDWLTHTYTGVGSEPAGIAFDGTNMWAANAFQNSVTKITPTGAMMTYTGTGSSPYSIAFDGINIWTANFYGNSVTKIR